MQVYKETCVTGSFHDISTRYLTHPFRIGSAAHILFLGEFYWGIRNITAISPTVTELLGHEDAILNLAWKSARLHKCQYHTNYGICELKGLYLGVIGAAEDDGEA